MSYIGNTNTTQAFIPAVDFFSGNASTTAFTLSKSVASVAQVQAVVNNVPQKPFDAFTVSDNTITFTSAPSSGTNNIYVYYTSPNTQVIAPSAGTVGLAAFSASGTPSASTFLRGDNSWQIVSVTPTAISDQLNSSTGYFDLPTGTTAQRPASPVVGMIRYNTTLGLYEAYTSAGWGSITVTPYPYVTEYLIVAGGGGGSISPYGGGGGGAGGVLNNTNKSLIPGTSYTITVGGGGASATSGTNSSMLLSGSGGTAFGGGGGNAVAGGSGSGGGHTGSSGQFGAATQTSNDGGTGYGNNGGTNTYSGVYPCGSGGGAGSAGGNNAVGGSFRNFSTSGAVVAYAGGGGQAVNDGGGVTAGGGAGAGNGTVSGNSSATIANRGSGGGGGKNASSATGSSGVVIISYPGAQRGTGGTYTSVGGNSIHTFTSSGTYVA